VHAPGPVLSLTNGPEGTPPTSHQITLCEDSFVDKVEMADATRMVTCPHCLAALRQARAEATSGA
jgi:hypothetical protein